MTLFLIGFAVIAGLLNAVQAGFNASLGKSLGNPFAAALAVAAVSFTSIAIVGLVSGRLAPPEWRAITGTPWWYWAGGVFAALFVLSQLFVAEQLGSALFMGLAVTAAIMMSVALDHFGLAGFEKHPAGLGRLAGGALMIAGVGLIARF